jgi:flagellar hook-associated protein 2
METKKAFEDFRLKAFNDLRAKLTEFQLVVNQINTRSRFFVREGTFINSNPTNVNPVAGLEVSSQAASSSFALNVTQLAGETKTVSQGFATASTVVSTGTITLIVGGVPSDITLDASNNTGECIRDANNNAGLDVRAPLLNDGDPATPIRLLVSGTETGLANAIGVSITDGGGGALATFTETQAAQDALFTLDGVSISKAANTVTDAIEGATLTLLSPGQGTLSISTDSIAIKENVQSFVDGFNEVILFVNEQLAFDLDTDTEGTLFGNFTLLNLQTNLRSTVSGPVDGASGTFSFLSQIGIRTSADGTLTINDS